MSIFHAIVIAVSFWCSISTIVFAICFMVFLETHNRISGFIATMETPGWRGIVPSILFTGSIISAFASALATSILNLFL